MRTLGIPITAPRFLRVVPARSTDLPMAPQVKTTRRASGERGAVLVEFALILPVFMMLVLGMFSGGLAYNQRQSLAFGAREGSRYAATLSIKNFSSIDDWLKSVADYVVETAEGELDAGIPGRSVCVAYVSPSETRRLIVGSGYSNFQCPISDGRGSEERVQVLVGRTTKLETLFFSHSLDLRVRSISRVEATQ